MSYRDDREAWALRVDQRLEALEAKPKEPPEPRTPWYLNHPLTSGITVVGLFAALVLIVGADRRIISLPRAYRELARVRARAQVRAGPYL